MTMCLPFTLEAGGRQEQRVQAVRTASHIIQVRLSVGPGNDVRERAWARMQSSKDQLAPFVCSSAQLRISQMRHIQSVLNHSPPPYSRLSPCLVNFAVFSLLQTTLILDPPPANFLLWRVTLQDEALAERPRLHVFFVDLAGFIKAYHGDALRVVCIRKAALQKGSWRQNCVELRVEKNFSSMADSGKPGPIFR